MTLLVFDKTSNKRYPYFSYKEMYKKLLVYYIFDNNNMIDAWRLRNDAHDYNPEIIPTYDTYPGYEYSGRFYTTGSYIVPNGHPSIYFDGTNGYINVENFDWTSLDIITVDAFVRNIYSNRTILGFNSNYFLTFDSYNIKLGNSYWNNYIYIRPGEYFYNKWIHVIITIPNGLFYSEYDNNKDLVKMYYNLKQYDITKYGTFDFQPFLANTQIAANPTTSYYKFRGWLGDFKIFKGDVAEELVKYYEMRGFDGTLGSIIF